MYGGIYALSAVAHRAPREITNTGSGRAHRPCAARVRRFVRAGKDDARSAGRNARHGEKLSPPGLLLNMDKAVSRILAAVDSGERIAVFGDYDVDGVTATALLYTYLDSIGADVYYKLPSRDDDGYGLSENAVELMASRDVTLIITVDNGISAHAAVARAKELGVDVVVTDHHLPPAELPDAVAVVDPQLPGDKSPCKSLCGAGVAFKLAAALEGCDPEELLPFYGDLAAIGTVADIMTLEGENRHIVKAGLAALAHTDRPGLAALIRSCGFEGKALTAENISFGLSPRLNAAGRMDSAAEALELLLCEDEEEAERLAASLEDKNAARQKAEQEIAQSITEAIEADASYGADRILVVAGHGYHQGVIGIVASRIVEKYGKPAHHHLRRRDGRGQGFRSQHQRYLAVQRDRGLFGSSDPFRRTRSRGGALRPGGADPGAAPGRSMSGL